MTQFNDRQNRLIDLRRYVDGSREEEYGALVAMYRSLDPAVRENGIPPITEANIRPWLDKILTGESVIAWHGTRAVGHVVLVPDTDRGHELAIFVHQDYHRSGIGGRLVNEVLGIAANEGIDHILLMTTGNNLPMLRLAHRSGFEETGLRSGQVELAFRPPAPA